MNVSTQAHQAPQTQGGAVSYQAAPLAAVGILFPYAWARGLVFFLFLALSCCLFACSCGGPPPVPDAGDGGNIITPDGGEALKPPTSWGTQKMAKTQACGTFKWGDLSCDDGLACVKKGPQGLCLQSCDPKGTGCTNQLPCQEVVSGTWACLTKETLTAEGEECKDLPCQPPFSCVRANYEQAARCRAPCDPHPEATNACPSGFICGILPSGGGSCVPRPEGSVEEFGKCGGTHGLCKAKPSALKCVLSTTRTPSWGSCLQPCSDTQKCPDGLVCVASVGACAKACDPDVPNCDYGTCNTQSKDQSISVCY